ncbi:PaaI family thioesterase [Corynebacterium pacaense]|uniref:PaaI family thioesterase n=1 Tax=Corynebacterium pacaense TaxID=1816684 RepID=UPI0009BA6AE6|nr:PaaI family thioesterase [Corynebacterium pacaense]
MTNLEEILALAADRALSDGELARLNEVNVGLDRALGLRYTIIEPGRVVAELHVASRHLQPAGLVNGGVYASLAESTASLAGMVAARGGVVVGVNNNTDFISSVRSGVITAEATPIQLGGRTQIWQILCTHRGDLVSRTTLRTMIL